MPHSRAAIQYSYPAFACVLLGIVLSVSPAAQRPATDQGQSSGSAAPAPQEAADTGPQRFRTEANYVRVDAYPTRNGEPVQDLRMEEFEILEDGKPQVVRAFEHVVISPAGPQSLRVEASSVQGGEQMAANPRNRVFVFFLDVAHVPVEGSHHIKEPLIRLMDRVLGPDDLVAVMTPEMSAAQITFGRKTDVIAEMLRENWTWGRRHSIMPVDQREIEYERCYPYLAQRGVVAQMVARRRERIVLDALHDLVRYLGGVREERKAIVTVSNGWVLYRPNASLTDLRTVGPGTTEPVPGLDPVGVDEHGKLRVGAERRREGDPVSQTVCDRERMHLAAIDNDQYFRYLIDLANRHNASFYTVDPRGLAVFDYPIGPAQPPPIALDMASLRTRLETLQTLAEGTDGMAVVNSNDLDKGLRRIADDLTSYYLLGYYSTNARLDGGFRKITVRVKRPGVQVRARRGYRAATAEEVSASRAAAAAPVAAGTATASSALAMLGRIRPEQRFSVNAVPVRSPDGGTITAIWVAGEVEPAAARELRTGGTAVIELSGGTTARASAALAAGARTFLVRVPVADVQGAVDVRARVTADAGTADRLSDTTRIEAITSPAPLLFRRGVSTGNRIEPAADFRFSRTERLRLELAIPAGATPGAGRFLDRNAQPLQLPVQIADRVDADGQRWLTADAALSPLGAGDYVIEIVYTAEGAERRILTAVRVTR